MKGKGAKMTYWLLGEDSFKRAERTEARTARRKLNSNQQLKLIQQDGIIQRSSLKNRNSPLPRCTSLESSKRLRFASGDRLELFHHRQLDSISDNNISNSVSNSLKNEVSTARRISSSSCPCIENLANQSFEESTESIDKFCLSHPNLFKSKSSLKNTSGLINAEFLTIPLMKTKLVTASTPLLNNHVEVLNETAM